MESDSPRSRLGALGVLCDTWVAFDIMRSCLRPPAPVPHQPGALCGYRQPLLLPAAPEPQGCSGGHSRGLAAASSHFFHPCPAALASGTGDRWHRGQVAQGEAQPNSTESPVWVHRCSPSLSHTCVLASSLASFLCTSLIVASTIPAAVLCWSCWVPLAVGHPWSLHLHLSCPTPPPPPALSAKRPRCKDLIYHHGGLCVLRASTLHSQLLDALLPCCQAWPHLCQGDRHLQHLWVVCPGSQPSILWCMHLTGSSTRLLSHF